MVECLARFAFGIVPIGSPAFSNLIVGMLVHRSCCIQSTVM